MATVREMIETTQKVFSLDFSYYLYNRLWNRQDFHDLTKYEVLSVASLLYILSGEKKRELIIDALEENLGIKDPENAVKYVILHDLNSVAAAKMLFHRISYSSGLSLNNTVSKEAGRMLPRLYLAAAEMYLFSMQAVSPNEMHLNLAALAFHTWLDCQANNLLHEDEECEPFRDDMTWPSLQEFADIIHENELEFGSYEPMGDPDLDSVAEPICEYFLDWVTDGFIAFAEESKEPDFYVPYQSFEYEAALERYHFIIDYTARFGTYTDEHKLEENSLPEIIGRIYAMAKELQPHINKKKGSKNDVSLEEMTKLSLLKFFLYLTASDEYISGKEVRAINECLGFHFSKDQIKTLIKDQNVYTVTFEKETPPIMNVLMEFDKKIAEAGLDQDDSYANRYVDLCEKAGYLFLACDGNMNEDEKRDLQTIITNYRHLAEKAGQGSGEKWTTS